MIAFEDGCYVMVRHKDRSWEMPGGRLCEGETYEEGAKREFLEETGMEVELAGEVLAGLDGGKVLVGIVGRKVSDRLSEEIVEVRLVRDLPEELSFPSAEYRAMLAQAETIVETFKRGRDIGGSASPLTSRNHRRR